MTVPNNSPSRLDSPTAVHFGAGNIGLGFIGELLARAGYHVIFADINPSVISHLNEDHTYQIHYLEPTRQRPFRVQNVSGVLSSDKEGIMEVAEDIADKETRLITTSIGIGSLKHIAPLVAKGIVRRSKEGSEPINVIACENGKGATDTLKEEVYKHLDEEAKNWANQNVGFANCTVDRIVPQGLYESGKNKELGIGVDKFYEWIVDIHPLKSISTSPTPALEHPVPGMILTSNLPAYQSRKLFILNCGHAVTAYLGALFNYQNIHSSISDKQNVFPVTQGAMKESGDVLLKEYPDDFDKDEMESYINKTLGRFQNPNVVDVVERVARQPLRKLGPEERLLSPFRLAKKYNLPTTNLAIGIAAALMYRSDEDEQAVELKKLEEQNGMEGLIQKVLSTEKGSAEYEEIMKAYRDLEGHRSKFAETAKN